MRTRMYSCVQITNDMPNMISTAYYQERLICRYPIGCTDWLQFRCDNKEQETNKVYQYFGLLHAGKLIDKNEPVFINLSPTFVIGKKQPENQLKCRFKNKNVLVQPNHQEYPKRYINSLVIITPLSWIFHSLD